MQAPFTPHRLAFSSPPKIGQSIAPLSLTLQRPRNPSTSTQPKHVLPHCGTRVSDPQPSKISDALLSSYSRSLLPTIGSHCAAGREVYIKSSDYSRSSNNRPISQLPYPGIQARGNYGGSANTITKTGPRPIAFSDAADPFRHTSSNSKHLQFSDEGSRTDCLGAAFSRTVSHTERVTEPHQPSFAPIKVNATRSSRPEPSSGDRDKRIFRAKAVPDAYSAFSDDEDSTWSTLPPPKRAKPTHKAERSSAAIKQSGRFKLPLSLLPEKTSSCTQSGSAQPKRRVITYLPPPNISSPTVAVKSAGARTANESSPSTTQAGKPVDKWKITRYVPHNAALAHQDIKTTGGPDRHGAKASNGQSADASTEGDQVLGAITTSGMNSYSETDILDSDATLLDSHSLDVLSSDDTLHHNVTLNFDTADVEERYPDVRKAMLEVRGL